MKSMKTGIRPLFLILLSFLLSIALCACDAFPEDYYFHDDWITEKDGDRDSVAWTAYSLSSDETKTFTFTKFSGIKTIYSLEKSSDAAFSCEWDVTLEDGKFKIVLIDVKEKKIIKTICEGSDSGNFSDLELPNGNYIIRFVGYCADVSGEIHFSTDQGKDKLTN